MILALALALSACNGNVGTLSVKLATAPGSHVLDGVQTLRLVITSPHQVTMAERTNGGFAIIVDLPATGIATSLIVDGLDANGQIIATGASPPFPVGALTATVVVYMAAPNSIGASPASITPARSELGVAALPFGAIFAGGRDAAGAVSDAIAIYNSFDHTLVAGKVLPARRAGLVVAPGAGGSVYLFGGRDAAGTATSLLWRFDTTVAPNGGYVEIGDKPGYARADQIAVPLGNDRFLLSGSPAAELSGLDGKIVTRNEVAVLPPAGVTLTATDGIVTTMFAGAEVSGYARYRNGVIEPLAEPAAARTGHGVVVLPGGKIGVMCGGATFPDALRIDAATKVIESIPTLPVAPKIGCAIAATSRHLVVAGGTLATGDISATADVYDAVTLALIASVPLVVPRTGATAIALPNDQILIIGGVDANGAPIATIELFTPAAVE